MKRYSLLPVFILFFVLLRAQDKTITGTKQISKSMTPQQVIDSLHKHFPDAKSIQYYKPPADAVQRGWNITEQDNLDAGAEIDYYTISFNRQGLKYYGLYEKDGTLVKAKIEQNVENLPDTIKHSLMNLSKQYPGYKVVSKKYYKNQNYTKSEEYFEVVAQNGNAKKTLYYNNEGALVKVKD
ncbi:MAG: hypothetical protein E6H09_06275 [Bacteroidetes bacterium]|jgi:hypothetical protein|nr:MAG: hypothetical protein E6H09_06275 [Bacteroidota bacterium]